MTKPLLPNLSPQHCAATAPPAPAGTSTSLAQAGDLLSAVFTAPRRWATSAYNVGRTSLGWESQGSQAEPHTVFEMWSFQRGTAGLSPRVPAAAATTAHSPPPTPAQPASEDGSELSQASSTHQHPGSPATVLNISQNLSKVAQQVRHSLLGVSSEQSTPSEAASDSVLSMEGSMHSMESSEDSYPVTSPPPATAFAALAAVQPAIPAPAKPEKEGKHKGIHRAARFALHAVVLAAAAAMAVVAASRHRRDDRKDKRSSSPAVQSVAC